MLQLAAEWQLGSYPLADINQTSSTPITVVRPYQHHNPNARAPLWILAALIAVEHCSNIWPDRQTYSAENNFEGRGLPGLHTYKLIYSREIFNSIAPCLIAMRSQLEC